MFGQLLFYSQTFLYNDAKLYICAGFTSLILTEIIHQTAT